MGMSIDEAMNYLIAPRIGSTEISSVQQKQLDAYTMARETMRKYQKIKEQVDIAIDKENFAISGARLIQIREIINGNDD